ncbi:Tex family protein [Clostridium aminobutyricum]|uniref:RNA-binding transcriptional accessory protein n=1 Tax=Clostridium aminobutyricum TaxID=33953 RepID=A0A939IGA9_CLOAM|nr:Tex family protein [Clostridium aminobutyricum]MBN7773005.1 RNA-binding transcriptional accessory protein [Clostridium aminobutyricum]
MNIIEKLAMEFSIKISQVENTVQLIDEGNTIPFIARYRKEVTGGLSDVILRDLEERLNYLKNLETRKEEVIRIIEEQGKLTEELKVEIEKAEVLQRVEDLYKPYKQKKSTRASKAKEKGLEPLALLFFAQEIEAGSMEELAYPYVSEEKGVETVEEAIQGAMDIIAEKIADDPELTALVREKTQKAGLISTEAADEEEKTVYEMYYGHQEGIDKIPNHRVLAVNRGEKEKKLKVKVIAPIEELQAILEKQVVINEKSIFTELLKDTITDAYKRLIAPSIEREMRNNLTERAELEAVKVFAKNTEKLLMVPPVKGARIISIDPGYRTGCKVAVLNETGKLLAYTTVYPTEPKRDIAGTEATLKKLVEKFKINTIVIGNGTASRETEEVVENFIKKNGYDVNYTIVNEAGASVYSASKLATEEYPDLDVTTRGAMSLGRRLQDPLAELVKISPKSIGVGQYQHDIDQNLLNGALTNVVEDCVNRVGVDLNTASPSLLSYIAGINMGIAKNIVAYREEVGQFTARKELLKVAKLGEKTYKQCAGFMRIADGKNPLDATSVHPESYAAADTMLLKLGIDKEMIRQGGAKDIEERICETYPALKKAIIPNGKKGLEALAVLKETKEDPKKGLGKSIEKLADDIGIGAMTLKDIIEEIKKPGRDPREDTPAVVFRNDVRSFEDLKVDMELMGTVRNVVDFGAFVDIGVKNDGLVHISQISNKFIKHPMDAVAVGDTVKVKILSIDHDRHKIALTMKF